MIDHIPATTPYGDITLRPVQKRYANLLLHRESLDRGLILAMEAGTGKTITALSAINQSQRAGPTLIVVPNRQILDQWAEHATRYFRLSYFPIIQGQAMVVIDDKQPLIYLMLHSLLSQKQSPVHSVLFNTAWARIVIDEAHVLKNPKSNIYTNVARFDDEIPRWLLTGTPLQNREKELKTLGSLLNCRINDINDLYDNNNIVFCGLAQVVPDLPKIHLTTMPIVLPAESAHASVLKNVSGVRACGVVPSIRSCTIRQCSIETIPTPRKHTDYCKKRVKASGNHPSAVLRSIIMLQTVRAPVLDARLFSVHFCGNAATT